MPPDLVAKWQRKLDSEYPRGAVVSWQQPGTPVTYLVPRLLVTGTAGLDPQVWLPVFAGSDKTLGPFRVLSQEQVQDDPRMVKAVLDNVESPMLWNAGVSDEAAAAMAADREKFMQLAPHGGARVFDGDAPE